MTFNLGLTGSIGMGKSTTAGLFRDEGCAVWDADAAVHRLYAVGGAAVPEFEDQLPSVVKDGAVSRDALKDVIAEDPGSLAAIEAIVHPLVRQDRQDFMDSATADIRVFDIPLLFETQSEAEFDAVACVYIDADLQHRRVMERGTMTAEQLAFILSKQMPVDEKRVRADFEIEANTISHAREQVRQIVHEIRNKMTDA